MNTDAMTRESADSLFSDLQSHVVEAGYLERAPQLELRILASIVALYGASFYGLLLAPSWSIRGILLILLAYLSVQAGLIAHEAAHRNITGNFRTDRLIGLFSMSLLVGISYTRFWDLHSRHHWYGGDDSLMPHVPCEGTDNSVGAVRRRAWTARILFLLMGVLQKFTAVQYIGKHVNSTRGDQVGLFLHYLIWIIIPAAIIGFPTAALNYFLLALLTGPYAGTLYFITHEGMHIVDTKAPPPYLLRQLLSTRDLGRGCFDNLLLAGVNHHVGHHLFPNVPRFQLAKARRLIFSFCRAHGIPYTETSTGQGFRGLSRSLYNGSCQQPDIPESTVADMRFLARNGHKVWWDEKAATKMEVDDVRTSMA
jgi:fatty acid desaturase